MRHTHSWPAFFILLPSLCPLLISSCNPPKPKGRNLDSPCPGNSSSFQIRCVVHSPCSCLFSPQTLAEERAGLFLFEKAPERNPPPFPKVPQPFSGLCSLYKSFSMLELKGPLDARLKALPGLSAPEPPSPVFFFPRIPPIRSSQRAVLGGMCRDNYFPLTPAKLATYSSFNPPRTTGSTPTILLFLHMVSPRTLLLHIFILVCSLCVR